jgi:hypothetical protein
MATEPLQHLTEQSAGVGAWMLKVADEPQDTEYTWNKNGKSGKGRKLECIFVSDDSTQYCQGVCKRLGQEPKATQDFAAAKMKYKKGTIWKVSKVSLARQNPKYLGCSCKVVIDMNTSTFQPVLQSTVQMPMQATPPEDLNTLLQCPAGQVVDVLVLVTDVSQPVQKTTQFGVRDLVNITIMDDSGDNGAASCQFPAWFPKTLTGSPCDQLKQLTKSVGDRKPVSFFNLVCQKENATSSASEHGTQAKTTLKTCREKFSFEICNIGTKAERLKSNAETLIATDSVNITVVSELPTFTDHLSNTKTDYLAIDSTFTVCRLLQYTVQAGPSFMDPDASGEGAAEHALEKDMRVFQINHARILEPKAGENLYTNAGDRLFPTMRVMDSTGTVELKMRESTALELSGEDNKETFAEMASKGGLNFPILCTIRVCVRKSAERGLDAIIVEAAEQDLLCPRAMPNASMDFVSQLLLSLPSDANRMVVAPISAVRHVRHAGMVVDTLSPTPLQASCVLSLVAHVGRSVVHDLPGGHKLISQDCWNVPFEEMMTKEEGAPEHADKKICGEVASYCTMNNVQDYTLTGRRPKEAVYALIIISSVHEASTGVHRTYMVDKVNIINQPDSIPTLRSLLRKLARIPIQDTGMPNCTPEWQNDKTPYTAKKARRLGNTPTDDAMQSPPRAARLT